MECIETAVSQIAGVEQTQVWVDLEKVPTSEEAGEALILNAIEKVMHQAVGKSTQILGAGYIRLSADRTILALSGPWNRISKQQLIDLISRLINDYGSSLGSGVEIFAPEGVIHPRGTVIPFPFYVRRSELGDKRPECFQRLLAAHCVVVWLISGSDVFEVAVSPPVSRIATSNSLSRLTFDFSDRPTIRAVFEKVRDALCGSCDGYTGTRRTGAPIRSAVIHSQVPACTLKAGELHFSVLSVAPIGQWRATTEVIENGPSVVITSDCDVLDGQTIGDLLVHVDRCLDCAPNALASEVSLTST